MALRVVAALSPSSLSSVSASVAAEVLLSAPAPVQALP